MPRTLPGLVLAAALMGYAALGVPATLAQGVQDIPAVNPQRYPDNIGYLYQGAIATVLWMQNIVPVASRAELERHLHRSMTGGLSGEFVASTMQRVDPILTPQPMLPDLAQRAVQSVRLLAQYAFVARDYAQSLSDALGQYNEDVGRHQAIAAAAARVEAAFGGIGAAGTGGPVPASPPPARPRMMQPGQYFADAVLDGRRTYLRGRAHALQQAIQARDAVAYGSAFPDVFYAQLESTLRDSAREALAVSHEDAFLTGQPLDAVIARYVRPAPGEAFAMDQLRLINQLNLMSNGGAAALRPLVAALLLLAEDHRQGEQDIALACGAIWAHVHDLDWLVAHYVRVKAAGATTHDVLTMIDSIVASITAR